ncbi:MAG TPA: hypothetical protein VH044_08090 [Polyangiaceae bacterium]|jgi:hypothetical protein|nr:hypothetical protein [Polyangiaceae bacterium]
MLPGARSSPLVACAAAVATTTLLLACSPLLDLDVQYADATDSGTDAPATPDPDAPGPAADDATMPIPSPEASSSPPADAPSSPPADALPDPSDGPTTHVPDAAPIPDAGARPPPHWVQDQFEQTAHGALSLNVTLTAAVTPGDTLVLAADYDSNEPLEITDNAGLTFRLAGGVPAQSTGFRCGVWYVVGAPGGTETVTLTFSGITPLDVINGYLFEYSGVSGFDDASSAGSESGTAMSSGDIITTASNELLFGFAVTSFATAGTSFRVRRTESEDVTEDRIVPLPSTVQATATTTGAPWAMIGAAFKP